MLKNSHHNFLNPKLTPLNVLFCLNSSPKPKDIQLTIMQDKKKQQILKFKNLKPSNTLHCCFKK